jgi:lipopolysaccharide export LptBFGC system permease protein LptF
MVGGAKYYIIYNFFKYILTSIFIFIGLIWVSQILRVLDLQHTISFQILDVMKTTILVLPSFISPISSFLLLLASFFLNYKLNSSNEIIIFKQYLKYNDFKYLFIMIMTIIFVINFLNKEFFSVNTYHKYKIEELEIRNNLKLGNPNQNEFYIDGELSLFFDNERDDIFYNVDAILYKNNQFIKSKTATIEVSKKNFNLIFQQGQRVSINSEEMAKTNFERFIYSIKNKNLEKLSYDKQHFNTIELMNHNNIDFVIHGHNRLFQYLLTLYIIMISIKVFFIFREKESLFKLFSYIFALILFIQIINSYLIYSFINQNINISNYYILNLMNVIFINFLFKRQIK